MFLGISAELMPNGNEKEIRVKYKSIMTMMDSMTNEGGNLLCNSNIMIARSKFNVNGIHFSN